jgi:DtxR family Mn-dependent transcriptional regulator
MHAAAIEQFLNAIYKARSDDDVSLVEIAQATHTSQEQAQQAIQTLAARGLIRVEAGAVGLTTYGMRRLLTESIEDYVLIVYRASRDQDSKRVSTSAIAQALGVSAPSVTSMIKKKLTKFGLVDYERHRGVTLTPLGERVALQILRHHRVVELYLTETLGLSWDQVHEEASRLEHAISPALIDRMAAILGDPLVDPHGDPIPRKDGTVERLGLTPLYEVEPGQAVVVRRVRDQSPDVLRYLGEVGLTLGALVEIVARAPFDGPLTVRVGGNRQILGQQLARVVLVTPQEEQEAEDKG